MEQVNALIKQSATKERYALQDRCVDLAGQYAGYTATQLAWIAAGGSVDAQGFCQPASAFNMALAFFNAKRRICEIAKDPDDDSGRRPNAKLLYGKALCNPYEFGGAGVYPIGERVDPAPNVRAEPVSAPVATVAPVAEPFDIAGLIASLD